MLFIRYHFFTKLVFILFLLNFTGSVFSIKKVNLEVIAIPTVTETAPKGVSLIWYLKSPLPTSITEYQVYRNNIKIATLSTKVDLKQLIKTLKGQGTYALYQTLFSNGKDASFEDSWFQLQFLAITLSRFNRGLLPFLQNSFVDKKLLTSSATYRVDAYADKDLLVSGLSLKVRSSQKNNLVAPQNVKFNKKKETIGIKFSIPLIPVSYIQGVSYSFELKEENFKKRKRDQLLIQETKCISSKVVGCTFEISLSTLASVNATKEKELFFAFFVVFQDGRLSPLSIPKKIDISYVTALEAPEVQKVVQKKGTLAAEIIWKPLKEKNISHYLVYRSYNEKKSYKVIHSVPVPKERNSYVDRTIQFPAKLHYYKVRGVSTEGVNGLFSKPVPFLPKSYVKPRIIQVKNLVPIVGGVKISFKKLERKDIYQYRLYQRVGHSGIFAWIETLKGGISNTSFTIKNLDSRNSYCYVIRALDIFSNISEPQKPWCVRPLNSTSVNPPSTLAAILDQGGIVLKWTASNNTFSDGFYIFRKDSITKKFAKISQKRLFTDRIFIDKDISRGIKYTYYVISVAQGGLESVPSIQASIFFPLRKLEFVQNLKIYRKKSNVILTWVYSSDINAYHIYMKPVFYKKKTNKKKGLYKQRLLGKTKKMTFTFAAPKKAGKYELFVVAISGKNISPVKEKRYLFID